MTKYICARNNIIKYVFQGSISSSINVFARARVCRMKSLSMNLLTNRRCRRTRGYIFVRTVSLATHVHIVDILLFLRRIFFFRRNEEMQRAIARAYAQPFQT